VPRARGDAVFPGRVNCRAVARAGALQAGRTVRAGDVLARPKRVGGGRTGATAQGIMSARRTVPWPRVSPGISGHRCRPTHGAIHRFVEHLEDKSDAGDGEEVADARYRLRSQCTMSRSEVCRWSARHASLSDTPTTLLEGLPEDRRALRFAAPNSPRFQGTVPTVRSPVPPRSSSIPP
jgi:hypothetical protein